MRLSLTGRHVDISPRLRQLVEQRLVKLERLLNDSVVSTQVVLTLEKRQHRAELVVHARGDHTLTAICTAETWPTAVGEAVEKVVQQAHKVKDKWRTRKRRATGSRAINGLASVPAPVDVADGLPSPEPARIVRMPRYVVKPMRVEDAARRMERAREPFVVFRHAETERIAILFARPDGRLGLIDPEP